MTAPDIIYRPTEVAPFEAARLPVMPPDPTLNAALRDLLTAVNGFPYSGERADALVVGIRWLRTRPDVCYALGLCDAA